jgi:RND family efflux transporter MFP subunit
MFPHRRLLLLFSWFGLLGCNNAQPAMPPFKLPEVEVSQPVTKDVTEYEDFTGQTQAIQTIEIRARVSGYLAKTNLREGELVTEGAVLFEIDDRPYKAELAQAEANLVQAEAHARRLGLDLRRAERLAGRGAMSQEDYDKTVGDKAEAEAAVGSARASRDRAKLNLDFTKVKAPITGRVSRRLIDPWNMVKADETPLTMIVSSDKMYAYFDIDEANVLKLRRLDKEHKVNSFWEPGMPVYLGLGDEEGFPHEGVIDFVDNQVDSTTGTLRMRGVFPNADRLIAPGLFVRIRLPIGKPHKALLVAEQAIGRDQGQKFLYVVNAKNQVEYRSVQVGRQYGGLREIVEGLKKDERLIVSGLQRVRVDKNKKNDSQQPDVETKMVAMPAQETRR